jgi:glyoxylase-like metal-dependent hydrolase (beta-lactamase superfamily II)
MIPHTLASFEVLVEGKSDGSLAVLKITPTDAEPIHAVAVPQDWCSYTGPTWVYIIEASDGFTLIDAGSALAAEHLSHAFGAIGIDRTFVKRVIITHGHSDHDGGALELAQNWGVDVWAHALWDKLRFYDRAVGGGQSHRLVQQALDNDGAGFDPVDKESLEIEFVQRRQRYRDLRRDVNVARLIDDGDTESGLTFYHTPGHAPDELTIAMRDVLFAGDHILPEISPHPTLKTSFPSTLRSTLPMRYRVEKDLYGLDVYLKSLMMIAAMGDEALVLPAHRLLNRGRLNIITSSRAREIADHHRERLHRILELLGANTWSLSDLTQSLFAHRSLQGVYQPALSETMAHVELLISSGDVALDPDGRFTWAGSQRYLDVLSKVQRS